MEAVAQLRLGLTGAVDLSLHQSFVDCRRPNVHLCNAFADRRTFAGTASVPPGDDRKAAGHSLSRSRAIRLAEFRAARQLLGAVPVFSPVGVERYSLLRSAARCKYVRSGSAAF